MEGYSVSVIEASKELSKREKVMYKDLSRCMKFDEILAQSPDKPLVISPDFYVMLSVHNEHSKNQDYNVFVIVDKSGSRFMTSSPSFISSFKDIEADMEGEEYDIEVYFKKSKNYEGKNFITCSLV